MTPHRQAGMRTEPPVSVPRAPGTSPAATAAPLPPLEPPQMRVVSQGLWAAPKWGLTVVAPQANSWVFSFPTTTAPARRRPATAAASSRATLSARIREPAVVRLRRDVDHVLDATGTPYSGPRTAERSSAAASSTASSPRTVMNELRAPSRSIRRRRRPRPRWATARRRAFARRDAPGSRCLRGRGGTGLPAGSRATAPPRRPRARAAPSRESPARPRDPRRTARHRGRARQPAAGRSWGRG